MAPKRRASGVTPATTPSPAKAPSPAYRLSFAPPPKPKEPEAKTPKKAAESEGGPEAAKRARIEPKVAPADAEPESPSESPIEEVEEEAEVEGEIPEEDWGDMDRRVQAARELWAAEDGGDASDISAAAFCPTSLSAPVGQVGRTPFRLLTLALDAVARQPRGLGAVRPLANLIRCVLEKSSDREADLRDLMTVMLGRRPRAKACRSTLVRALQSSGLVTAATLRIRSPPTSELPAFTLAAKQKTRTLSAFRGPKLLLLSEVAAVIAEAAKHESATQAGPALADQVTKLLVRSSVEGREIWHLVRLLLAPPELPTSIILKAAAHGVLLGQSQATAEEETLGQTLVEFEDMVARAYAEEGGESQVLAPALANWATTEKFLTKSSMAWSVPVLPMKAQESAGAEEALGRLGGGAVPLLAEWMLDGVRAQVHVREGGTFVQVFVGSKRCDDRWQEVLKAVQGRINCSGDCILEAMLMRPARNSPKKSKAEKSAAASAAAAEAASEGATESPADAAPAEPSAETPEAIAEADEPMPQKQDDAAEGAQADATKGATPASQESFPTTLGSTLVLFDALMIGGERLTSLPLRERRARLQAIVVEGPCLKLARSVEFAAGEASIELVKVELNKALSAFYEAHPSEKAASKALGLVLKRLEGPGSDYFAGRRSGGWQSVLKPIITGAEAEEKLLAELNEQERACLPRIEEFHFAVVSARRTGTPEGVRDILAVQKQFVDAGATPVWYVDEPSVNSYAALGLKSVVGGKLIPARNLALDDASSLGKVCVQCSDDISRWEFYQSSEPRCRALAQGNAAAKRAERLQLSPVAAARYLLAKMRASEAKPQLGGVYPLSNMGQCFCTEQVMLRNFILGDFFVVDKSKCRFDTRMTLKEDYDFTCSHLEAHGAVMRINRLIIHAKHETNAGGACSVRDAAGERERENIRILQEKWPGAIWRHPTRPNQVVLRWDTLKKGKQVAGDGVGTLAEEAAAAAGA